MAERHDFSVGFSLGIEVGAALGAADREPGQRIFEDLLKAEKFQDAEVDGRMQAQSALVRADGVVELDAVADVHAGVSLVVYPRHLELDLAVGLDEPFEKRFLLIERFVLIHRRSDGFEHLARSLQKFGLVWILILEVGENAFGVFHKIRVPF